MTRICKVFAASVMFFGFLNSAHASVLLEPYLGYYMGNAKLASSKTDLSGVGYGARAGYKSMIGLSAGAEYMGGMWKTDSNPKSDMNPGSLGVFVGFDFPVMVRAYVTYFVMDKIESKNGSSKLDLEGKSGVKLGVGFTPLPLLSVNLEYGASEYDKVEGHSISSTPLKTSYYGLSVSVPFTF